MADLNDVLEFCSELDAKLTTTKEPLYREKRIKEHLELMGKKLKYIIPDFEKDLEWMNVSSSLSLSADLKGKIVVLDFFTYCCINCMHVLPDLEALEHVYSVQDGVVVVGVHSAKFDNEKISANILSAILRYGISHPVVNDPSMELWEKLQIICWPTFVIVGPEGQFLQTYVGEGHRQKLIEFVSVALSYYRGKELISKSLLPLQLEKEKLTLTPLYFPGKICVSEDGNRIAVSDTGHHRILVLGKDGIIQDCIGGQERGFKDGGFKEAKMYNPQGIVFHGNLLYIADTDNHCIRKADLVGRCVITIVGTGVQGNDKVGGKNGTEQEISSPWDVALHGSEGKKTDLLLIAMAGTHQIWVYYLQDAAWPGGSQHKAGTCLRYAGSGSEENRNGICPEMASFAQPSGLTVCRDLNKLYVADSESSTIRAVSLANGAVKNLVGGELDPRNLFAFGDREGRGLDAKLQHPLCVTLVQKDLLVVADSYNHKVKAVDLTTNECTTIKMGNAPSQNTLDEPGGICFDKDRHLLYIADTNNHSIKLLDWNTKILNTLPVLFSDNIGLEKSVRQDRPFGGISFDKEVFRCTAQRLTLKLQVCFAEGLHFTEDAPSAWYIWADDETGQQILSSTTNGIGTGKLIDASQQTLLVLDLEPNVTQKFTTLFIKLKIFFCDDNNACRMKEFLFKQPIVFQERSVEDNDLILDLLIQNH
ncbi:hypothetical protein ScPMuIL_000802 [Solemya velum]